MAPRRMRLQKARVDTSQVGTSGLRQFQGYLREEFLKDLQGQAGAQRYREMRDNDPVLGAMFNALEFFFIQTAFPISPAGPDSESQACAQFVRECFDDMDHTFQDLLSEVMTAPVFGHSEHEIVLKQRMGDNKDVTKRSRFSDGKIGWRRIALRKQESIYRWKFNDADPDTAVAFVQQTQTAPYFREVPLNRCVHFRMKADLGNPEGRSLLRNCHKPYTFLSGLQEIEAISHERLGCGFPVLPVPPSILDPDSADSSVATALLDALSQVRFGERSALLVPAEDGMNGTKTGYGKLEFMRPAGAASDMNATIFRWESRMAMTLLMDWLTVGNDQSGGSRAMHVDKTSMFSKSMSWLADRFCTTFTAQAVHPLCRINGFAQRAWPKLTHGPIVPISATDFAAYVNTMVGAGVLVPGPNIEAAALAYVDIQPEDHAGEMAPG